MSELADEADSKSVDGNIVRVQVPQPALNESGLALLGHFFSEYIYPSSYVSNYLLFYHKSTSICGFSRLLRSKYSEFLSYLSQSNECISSSSFLAIEFPQLFSDLYHKKGKDKRFFVKLVIKSSIYSSKFITS